MNDREKFEAFVKTKMPSKLEQFVMLSMDEDEKEYLQPSTQHHYETWLASKEKYQPKSTIRDEPLTKDGVTYSFLHALANAEDRQLEDNEIEEYFEGEGGAETSASMKITEIAERAIDLIERLSGLPLPTKEKE